MSLETLILSLNLRLDIITSQSSSSYTFPSLLFLLFACFFKMAPQFSLLVIYLSESFDLLTDLQNGPTFVLTPLA
ncbi:hypothetical protein PGT21_016180 [Puccinia graminis f. sp. tritici]|uniref:Uncharacterized protein n=1 Tax=Puccinia graminis f. sp. tritici TaxID=56615 RepID=A0A5B0MES5_PUCGR|nr:hypothetical protein PGT21_016180 [Puccinia graminis f. sp. tritici]